MVDHAVILLSKVICFGRIRRHNINAPSYFAVNDMASCVYVKLFINLYWCTSDAGLNLHKPSNATQDDKIKTNLNKVKKIRRNCVLYTM